MYEQDAPSLITRSQYLFNGHIVAQRTNTGSNPLVYLHGDHLGSVSVVTSETGAILDQQEYGPWGNIRSGNVTETTLNYTGQKRDGTGLLYYGARYYDPALGRFLSPDTQGERASNPQTLNRYSYVGNNPLNHTDPTGHDICGESGFAAVCTPPDPTPINLCDRSSVTCRPQPLQTPVPYKTPTNAPATSTPIASPTPIPTPTQPSVVTSENGTATPSASDNDGPPAFNGPREVTDRNPRDIHFGQDTISQNFGGDPTINGYYGGSHFRGATIYDLADALRTGAVQSDQIEAIRVMVDPSTGDLVSIDNRRLAAADLAEITSIPTIMATPDEVQYYEDQNRFTNDRNGDSIDVTRSSSDSTVIDTVERDPDDHRG